MDLNFKLADPSIILPPVRGAAKLSPYQRSHKYRKPPPKVRHRGRVTERA